jgi:sugar transferase (PEP-CTERM/EpsH1 system associated)
MNILYLVHRLPWPPDKGDKVRSYHLLHHLVSRHRVFLGTFVDDPADMIHLDTVRALCAGSHIARLDPREAKIRSLRGLWRGEPLTLGYYRDGGLQRWVETVLERERIDAAVVFSSSMAQYVERTPGLPLLVDFVDVDSAKWSQYAQRHRWPMSWIYRREGRRLLAYERSVARVARRSYFVTDREAELFVQQAPESAAVVEAMANGVDADFFAPDPRRASPYPAGQVAIVFTGAMDYWPNVDAVTFFVREVLPALRARRPELQFHIVGRNPQPAVRALAGEGVHVTGTVPDVRPYLQHAAVVVAPLRLARGIQNKVLEAMAMARPVVAAQTCVEAIDARPGIDLIGAELAEDYVQAIEALLARPERALALGAAARECVLAAYSWEAHLSRIDRQLDAGVSA